MTLTHNFIRNDLDKLQELYLRPKGIYALAHSVGPLCRAAKDDITTHFLAPWEAVGGHAWPTWLAQIHRFNAALAALLNASVDSFCPQPSVSFAFSQWLAAVSKKRDSKQRRVVLMHQDAFASLGFAVQGLCKVYALELKLLSTPTNDKDAWTSALSQGDVFACLLTHAHSNTGQLTQVSAIIDIAKQYKVLCAVDIAQSVGIIPIDLSVWKADCVVGSCVKWLSGGPGAAFLHIPYDQASELMPDHLAWFSHQDPFEFDIRHFLPAAGVMRFWGGTPSIAPFVMSATAIAEHNRFGTAAFRQHNLELMGLFLSQYPFDIPEHYQSLLEVNTASDNKNGASVCNDYEPQHSATLCLTLPKSQAVSIRHQLSNNNIKFDERSAVVRLSFSAINQVSDVSKIIECYVAKAG